MTYHLRRIPVWLASLSLMLMVFSGIVRAEDGQAASVPPVASDAASVRSGQTAHQIAPSPAPDVLARQPSAGLGASGFIQVLLSLIAVIAVFLACAWLMRRVQGGGFQGSRQMRLLGGLSLGARERMVLVEVGGVQILLGVAPGRVSTLHVFSEKVVNDIPANNDQDFAAKLRAVMQRGEAV